MGINDEFSDLDVWLLVPSEDLPELDKTAGTRFFEMKVDGKLGHLTAESIEEFSESVHQCHMNTIYHLRKAEIITDNTGVALELIRLVRTPMPPQVSDAFFFHHYVEMRSEDRACDNPMERKDPVAVLLSLGKAMGHALRAAMVLDGEPYPYDKWLHLAAAQLPTGRGVTPHIERIIDLLRDDALHFPGSQRENPISLELRAIRRILIDAARAKGNDAQWLSKWWLHIDQARDAIEQIRWESSG
jgi:hypothetical protein